MWHFKTRSQSYGPYTWCPALLSAALSSLFSRTKKSWPSIMGYNAVIFNVFTQIDIVGSTSLIYVSYTMWPFLVNTIHMYSFSNAHSRHLMFGVGLLSILNEPSWFFVSSSFKTLFIVLFMKWIGYGKGTLLSFVLLSSKMSILNVCCSCLWLSRTWLLVWPRTTSC